MPALKFEGGLFLFGYPRYSEVDNYEILSAVSLLVKNDPASYVRETAEIKFQRLTPELLPLKNSRDEELPIIPKEGYSKIPDLIDALVFRHLSLGKLKNQENLKEINEIDRSLSCLLKYLNKQKE